MSIGREGMRLERCGWIGRRAPSAAPAWPRVLALQPFEEKGFSRERRLAPRERAFAIPLVVVLTASFNQKLPDITSDFLESDHSSSCRVSSVICPSSFCTRRGAHQPESRAARKGQVTKDYGQIYAGNRDSTAGASESTGRFRPSV